VKKISKTLAKKISFKQFPATRQEWYFYKLQKNASIFVQNVLQYVSTVDRVERKQL